jgi:hypothetical protein
MTIREWVLENESKYKTPRELAKAFVLEMWAHLTPYETTRERMAAASRMIKMAHSSNAPLERLRERKD